MDIALNHLRYFYEVARQGSMTGAARALRVSQPGVSKIVKQLEAQQGVHLFDRRRRGVHLTAHGRVVLSSCEKIFGEVERLRSAMNEDLSSDIGRVSVAASDNLCVHLMPKIIAEMADENPGCEYKDFGGTSEAIQAEIMKHRADVGFLYSSPDSRKFRVEKIAFVQFSVVASKKLNLGNLQKLTFIGSRTSDYPTPFPALRLLGTLGIKPRQSFETNLQECQIRLAVAGLGYTVVPTFTVQNELRTNRLHEISIPAKERNRFGWPLLMISRRDARLSRAEARLVERLRIFLS